MGVFYNQLGQGEAQAKRSPQLVGHEFKSELKKTENNFVPQI